MSPDRPPDADPRLLYDVVTTLTANARRVATEAVTAAAGAPSDDLVATVSAALERETAAIIAGIDPGDRGLVGAVEASGRALVAVATQALRTSPAPPAVALDRAFELFASYIAGPGRARILDGSPDG